MGKNNSQIDEQATASALIIAKQKRVNKCTKEVNDVLEKYNCQFDVSAVLTMKGINFNIQVNTK